MAAAKNLLQHFSETSCLSTVTVTQQAMENVPEIWRVAQKQLFLGSNVRQAL